ncbi:MAG: helix-hairpin-helix domain-containing protein [Melioribacteraceae bacterium]|nr:helix-hairpin-helix domain-containing protein [Melioribacteraceae bacterium]MDD3558992.1 helix-hairpin-helix domain-containing protein [Melioribacteraceae bacterium]
MAKGNIKRILQNLGFTDTELKVIFFLCVTFFLGLTIKYYKEIFREEIPEHFDYSEHDSLFELHGKFSENNGSTANLTEKRVDSEHELLDFSKDKTVAEKEAPVLKEKSIDLNKAGISELMLLPGIGEVIAQRIIDYRIANGPFTKLENLKNVKGIGTKTYEKLSKYIIIE